MSNVWFCNKKIMRQIGKIFFIIGLLIMLILMICYLLEYSKGVPYRGVILFIGMCVIGISPFLSKRCIEFLWRLVYADAALFVYCLLFSMYRILL